MAPVGSTVHVVVRRAGPSASRDATAHTATPPLAVGVATSGLTSERWPPRLGRPARLHLRRRTCCPAPS
eukprot:568290-Prymnesium_polylepis.1